jgi:hypothetical protein
MVGVDARLQAGRSRVRIRVGTTVFSPQCPDRRWNTASILCNGYWGSGLEVKRPEADVER